jgi:hypothetical protein
VISKSRPNEIAKGSQVAIISWLLENDFPTRIAGGNYIAVPGK